MGEGKKKKREGLSKSFNPEIIIIIVFYQEFMMPSLQVNIKKQGRLFSFQLPVSFQLPKSRCVNSDTHLQQCVLIELVPKDGAAFPSIRSRSIPQMRLFLPFKVACH
jgi:hypothetical protein